MPYYSPFGGDQRNRLHDPRATGLTLADYGIEMSPLDAISPGGMAARAAGLPFEGGGAPQLDLSRDPGNWSWPPPGAAVAQAGGRMANSATIQRGPYSTGVYVGAQPQVGVSPGPAQATGDPVADFKAQALAAARAPFQVPGGQEYNYGHLTAQQAAYDQGQPAREAKALADVAAFDLDKGKVDADRMRSEAAMTQARAMEREADYKQSPSGQKFVLDTIAAQNGHMQQANTPQGVAAKGQADILSKLYEMAPGAAGPDGKLPPLQGFLEAMARQGGPPVRPGTPEYSALMGSQYGPELDSRLKGEPYGLLETPFFGSLVPEGGYRYQMMRDLARRMVGRAPSQVGVSPSRASLMGGGRVGVRPAPRTPIPPAEFGMFGSY